MPPWCGLDFFFLQRGKGKATRAWKGEGNRERKTANGKEAESNNAGFKGSRFPGPGLQSLPWLKFNEHVKGARSL